MYVRVYVYICVPVHTSLSFTFSLSLLPFLCLLSILHPHLPVVLFLLLLCSFFLLCRLRLQDLSCNQLPELPESFYTLTTLRHLGLHRNCLRDLSEGEPHTYIHTYLVTCMTQLQVQHASENHFLEWVCSVPATFKHD